MNKRLIKETTEEYINYCRRLMIEQREIIKDFKLAYDIHKNQSGCRELQPPAKCRTCELYLEIIIAEGYNLDQDNETYRKAVMGND
jgi:hypothetical protein